MTPLDLEAYLLTQLYKRRFHRGGKSLRAYSIGHFKWNNYGCKIGYPMNGKNTKRRHRNKNKNLKAITAKEGSDLYFALKKYFEYRGDHVKTTAFWLQAYPAFRVDENGKTFGYKNVAIGKNSFQQLIDRILWKTLDFNNIKDDGNPIFTVCSF
eukprot:785050_1